VTVASAGAVVATEQPHSTRASPTSATVPRARRACGERWELAFLVQHAMPIIFAFPGVERWHQTPLPEIMPKVGVEVLDWFVSTSVPHFFGAMLKAGAFTRGSRDLA